MKIRLALLSITLYLGTILFPVAVHAAGLSLYTPKSNVPLGEQITVTVAASSADQPMNAVSGSLLIPSAALVVSISKQNSVVNFWTEEPHLVGNAIRFEGVIMNPGYQGSSAKLFTVILNTKRSGELLMRFTDGAVLANDGLGTNILNTLETTKIRVTEQPFVPSTIPTPNKIEQKQEQKFIEKTVALPVIMYYSPAVSSDESLYFSGKGEPHAITKIVLKDISEKSLPERFIQFFRKGDAEPDTLFVKNDSEGNFSYTGANNLLAGIYNATPFLVDEDTKTERPGFGKQMLVNNKKTTHASTISLTAPGLLVFSILSGFVIYLLWYCLQRLIPIFKRKINWKEKDDVVTKTDITRKSE